MTAQEWSTVAIAVATVVYTCATIIYTCATIALWRVTKASLDETRHSVETLKSSTYGLTLQGIAENHREIAFRALDSDTLQRTFMSPNPEDRELDSETRLFAGVLINHLETCYEHCRFGTIPDEFKGPLRRDIAGTITRIPALRRRWKEMRDQLEPEFVGFVEREMGGEKR